MLYEILRIAQIPITIFFYIDQLLTGRIFWVKGNSILVINAC